MKRLSFLLLLLSTQAFSYELISFSNNRIRTIEEILKETNMDFSKLSAFECSRADRNDLMTPLKKPNLGQDSLRVVGKNGRFYIYDQKVLKDPHTFASVLLLDPYLRRVLKTLNRLSTIPEMNQIINQLKRSPYLFYIKQGRSSYMPNMPHERLYLHGNNAGFISFLDELRPIVETFPFNQIGYGGMIFWNPKIKAKFIESDYKKRIVDSDLVLAHEMYHAYDGMRGLLDRRFVQSDHHEFAPASEYRAVYVENIVRKSLGYLYRRFYGQSGDSTTVKDMLDDRDEPIWIESPCITWL